MELWVAVLHLTLICVISFLAETRIEPPSAVRAKRGRPLRMRLIEGIPNGGGTNSGTE